MKLLALVLLILILGLQYQLWLGDGGLLKVAELKRAIAAQQAENDELRERNRTLEAEVRDLKDGIAAIEERARSELGMIKEGETFYHIVEEGEALGFD